MSSKKDNRSIRNGNFIYSMNDRKRLRDATRKYEYRRHTSKFADWRKKYKPQCDDAFCMNDGCEVNHLGFFQFKEMFKWIMSVMVEKYPDDLSAMISEGRIHKWISIHEGSEFAKLIDLAHSDYPRDPAKSLRVGIVQLSYLCKKSHSFETINDKVLQRRVRETQKEEFFYNKEDEDEE